MMNESHVDIDAVESGEWLSTGLPGLDQILHGLRAGDNVVLQVESIDEYVPFIEAFAKHVVDSGKKLNYFRFARHAQLLEPSDHVKVHELNPEMGFEGFLMEILDIVEDEGFHADYVFDCISDLAVDWYSDQMLANFFMITCPYLYRLDTIAYFAIHRNRHMSQAIESITTTAQVVIEVFEKHQHLYVQPIKVWRRYSPTMYMLHSWVGEDFSPTTNSAVLSETVRDLPKPWLDFRIRRAGVWRRTFSHAQETLAAVNSGKLTFWEAEDCFQRLLRMAVTRDPRFTRMASKYFQLSDLIDIFQRMVGTGLIGGKSLGMLLARAILLRNNPDWANRLETHDSFFIGSDVFYTYLVRNDCWWLRRGQRDEETYLDEVEEARERVLAGTFPDDKQKQFMEMLNYFGQSPIIVRSSSLLEDNYGNAFSGKYESVFCPNQGSPQDRLNAFMDAVRTVYASAMSADALNYRLHRGLLDQDEQMALLVQRVSGDIHGDRFFPQAAGVGFSFNPYPWDEAIDPNQGFLRMVLGLGTRAVDRVGEDYTRLVALNAPDKQPKGHGEGSGNYTQQQVDVLDLPTNRMTTRPLLEIADTLPEHVRDVLLTNDLDMEKRARQHGLTDAFTEIVDFDKLLGETDFVSDMHELLQCLQDAYQNAVDVEFTLNYVDEETYRINLVQCRPFQVRVIGHGKLAKVPDDVQSQDQVFRTTGPIIGESLATTIDRLIYVVPSTYSKLPVQKRHAVARLIGRLTSADTDGKIMLIGPGRWGTSSPSLGVPVSFQEIRSVDIICELAAMHEGLIPDISLGTHFFNDLVELNMLYLAVSPHEEGAVFQEELITKAKNCLGDLVGDAEEWDDVVKVIDVQSEESDLTLCLHADSLTQKALCYIQR